LRITTRCQYQLIMKMVITDTPDPENHTHTHTMLVSSIYIMIIIRQ